MIKLLVSDLDGTLLDKEKKVTTEDVEALQRVIQAGMEVCLASGRMHKELKKVMEEVGIPSHGISQNGAFVYTKEEKLLQSVNFEPNLARELYKTAAKYDLVSLICIDQTIYIPKKTEASVIFENRMFAPFIVKEDILDAMNEENAPCKLSFFGEMEILLEMKEEISRTFPQMVDPVVSDRDCVDLMPRHVNKGAGLKVLLQELGYRPENVVTIGDSFNDVSMLELTPHGFAMEHGHPEVRAKAKHTAHSVADVVKWILEDKNV